MARHFSKRGVELTVSNRTRAKAESLAAELGGKVVDFDQWRSALVDTDIAVLATDSGEPLLNNDQAAKVAQLRRNRPLLILDLSMPRNVDPGVDRLESVFLYDLDSVQTLVDAHYAVRVNEAERAQKIIAVAAREAWEKSSSRDCVPQAVLSAKMLLAD
ncbi:MAG TPA: hypothetical protein VGQ81_06775 [Acidobacteriota bacterium]|nr:hypothetical protein [Acidobacteriota bacterium]